MVTRLLLAFLFLLPLAACGGAGVRTAPEPAAPAESRTVYVEPFDTTMVPPEVEEGVFDLLVDLLNEKGASAGLNFIILNPGTAKVDAAWLRNQHYITGEILGYVEDSGCCSTSLRLKGRARLHQPGEDRPIVQLEVPREVFFEHDYSTVEAERRKLIDGIASILADRLITSLTHR